MSNKTHSAINTSTLIGRLTSEPELRQTGSGNTVCRMRLAVDGMGGAGQAGFIDIASFGPIAPACAEHLSKGRLIAVRGRLQWRQWETQDGGRRQAHSLIAEDIQFLDSRRQEQADTQQAKPTAEPAAA